MKNRGWLAAAVLGVVVSGEAQSSRWETLREVKAGATLIVETSNAYGPVGYDRCRLVSVDAASLTCVGDGKAHARLVFPVAQVEFVSRVTKPFHLGPLLVLALVGVFLGGVYSGSPTAIEVGGFGLLLAAIAGGISLTQHGLDAVLGRAPVPDERVQLIYRRLPVALPGGSVSAAVPSAQSFAPQDLPWTVAAMCVAGKQRGVQDRRKGRVEVGSCDREMLLR